jgi:hypothetical protein
MPVSSPRRKIFPLLLVAALAAPWVASAEPQREERPRASVAAPTPFALLGRLWSALTSVWGETGCRLDPDGRCAPDQGSGLTASTEDGCRPGPKGCGATRGASPSR